jgi:hypothetical protein
MHTALMAEFARARSEELQRRAASVRRACSAAGPRHPQRRPRIRRRLDLSVALESIARRFTRGASRERLGAEPPGTDLIGAGEPNAHE